MTRVFAVSLVTALFTLLSATAHGADSPWNVRGGGHNTTGPDRRSLTVAAGGDAGSGVVQLTHIKDDQFAGRFDGDVSCLEVDRGVATLTGTVSAGLSAMQGDLHGRSFRVAITDGKDSGEADSFALQLAKPGQTFAACGSPTPSADAGPVVGPLTLDSGDYTVAEVLPNEMPDTGAGGLSRPTDTAPALTLLLMGLVPAMGVLLILHRRA